MGGPAWLGIGAQRGGTSWLVNMLCEHPLVDTPSGIKEHHQLYRNLLNPWSNGRVAKYQSKFASNSDIRLGECTPSYLRAIWSADLVARVVPEEAPIFVILRDPVARFESAVRHGLTRRESMNTSRSIPRKWLRDLGMDAVWGGMYASQLEVWGSVLGRDRLTVLQYETAVKNPQGTVELLWRKMNLDPVPILRADDRSGSTSNHGLWELDSVDGLRDHLRHVFGTEVDRLADWGIDTSYWPNFADRHRVGFETPFLTT